MTTLEQKTCARCGDRWKEAVMHTGVLVDHFACGSIFYESGEGLEGLRCVRRQRDWLVTEVERYKKALSMDTPYRDQASALSAARGALGNLLAVVFGDGGQEAERLGDEAASVAEARVCLMRSTINEAGEREGCLRRKVVNLTAEVKRLSAEGLKALCATADTGELAMNLTVEVDELRHLVVSLRSLGPVIQALAESGEMDPVTRQLLVAAGEVLIGPKVGDDATGTEHSGGAVSPAAPGPGPV